ncbi:MAG: P-loop containing nucleoside triphosphate hydrolase protein [Olpidium bornovanus]|uniref:P-loop containing nucleoside triphosphate hydrolase protein n=1 Tax=Olpidium bornovanus TaxID=278681 RepID=A0A8H7ZRH0_9FUNG|nr:MAG: P-loop containing nucleoside triphosphate hydrolase protein [Olpidium bornovanus]
MSRERPQERAARAPNAAPREESQGRPDASPARWRAALKNGETEARPDDCLLPRNNRYPGSRLESPEDVLLHSASTLSRLLRVSEPEAAKIVRSVSRSILEPGPTTALRLKARLRHLSTGDEGLDRFLGGGIPAAGVTAVATSGTGKTQLCLQLCLTVQRSMDRGGLDGGGPGSKVFIAHLADLETQEHIIQYQLPVLLSNNNVKLIILDSAAANFRSMQEHGDGGESFSRGRRYYVDRARDICLLAQRLNVLGARHGAVVVCVNEVTAVVEAGDADADAGAYRADDDASARKRRRPPDAGFGDETALKPALGMAWSSMVTTRLQLLRRERFGIPHLEGSECFDGQTAADRLAESEWASSSATARSTTQRQLRVVRCPYLPPKSCSISIGPSGLKRI